MHGVKNIKYFASLVSSNGKIKRTQVVFLLTDRMPAKWTNNWNVVVGLSGVLYTYYLQSVDCMGYQQSSVTGIFH